MHHNQTEVYLLIALYVKTRYKQYNICINNTTKRKPLTKQTMNDQGLN